MRVFSIILDHIREMIFQGIGIRVCFTHIYALEDIEDDAREAVLIQEDFLVIGDLSDLAVVWLLVFSYIL